MKAANPGLFEKVLNAASSVPGRAIGTGLATSGLSVLGNAVTGQLDEKEPGKVISEALGAGLLGAGHGALGAVINNQLNKQIALGNMAAPSKLHSSLVNAASLGGSVAFGGLGGMIGGGISSAIDAAGVSGFGSSNTANAKNSMIAGTTAHPISADANQQYLAYLEANQIPYA